MSILSKSNKNEKTPEQTILLKWIEEKKILDDHKEKKKQKKAKKKKKKKT
jgi:hypothetical protein